MYNEYDPYTPVYKAVNTDSPSEWDYKNDEKLLLYMSKEIILESDAEMRRRAELLGELQRIFVQWVKSVAIEEKKMPEEEAAEIGATLLISGSHRLGIREPGADIDTICVAPDFCTRDNFFTSLKNKLLSHPDISQLNAIQSARAPIIEFEFKGVNIDLLFARLPTDIIPKDPDAYDDDKILKNVDSATEIILNGPRVTNMIYKLVERNSIHQKIRPECQSSTNFQIVLRCIRKWAKRRALYGNKFGYLGGINCNILVAFICQLYPKASPTVLLQRFFRVYKDWEWGCEKPIMLNSIKENPPNETKIVWSRNTKDLMPMITPAYPASNSSYTVSEFTLEIMKAEFSRGYDIVKTILCDNPTNDWNKLFESSDFFLKYHHYLRCNIIGIDDGITSRGWISYVEAKIRHMLRYISNLPIKPIHFYPVVSRTSLSANSICYFIGFNIDKARCRGNELRIDKGIKQFRDGLYENYTGVFEEGLDFSVESYTWKMLPKELFDVFGGKEEAKKLRNVIIGKQTPSSTISSIQKVPTQEVSSKEELIESESKTNKNELLEIPTESNNEALKNGKKRSLNETDQSLNSNTDEEKSINKLNEKDIFFPRKKQDDFVFQNIQSVTWNLIPTK